MAEFVKLNPLALQELRTINPRLVSYNVEMTEVTGGTFWKAYTEAQVDGTEDFPVIKDCSFFSFLGRYPPPRRFITCNNSIRTYNDNPMCQ